jgi:hypothetical protein
MGPLIHSSVLYRANCVSSYILLAPRDKDHYSPILDLERTLYTIIERERLLDDSSIIC